MLLPLLMNLGMFTPAPAPVPSTYPKTEAPGGGGAGRWHGMQAKRIREQHTADMREIETIISHVMPILAADDELPEEITVRTLQ